jgi:hypothetical protein
MPNKKTYLSNVTSLFTWTAFGGGPHVLQEQALYKHFNISKLPYMMNHSEDVAKKYYWDRSACGIDFDRLAMHMNHSEDVAKKYYWDRSA